MDEERARYIFKQLLAAIRCVIEAAAAAAAAAAPEALFIHCYKVCCCCCCCCCRYLHSRKLVYRDIKPANLLITSTRPPFLKLCDFGLVRSQLQHMHDSTAAVFAIVTAAWNASRQHCDLNMLTYITLQHDAACGVCLLAGTHVGWQRQARV